MSDVDARLADLRELREGLKSRMEQTASDQNFAVMGRLLVEVLGQIEELAGSAGESSERTGLSEFERKLADRARSTGSGRTKSG